MDNVSYASRQGGLVTDGDVLARRGVPGFKSRSFAHNLPGAQIKPYTHENKHFSTSHGVTMSTQQNLFLQDTYRRESLSRVFWDDIYGKTHGPGSTSESRERALRASTAPRGVSDVRPTRKAVEYEPTHLEKRRRLLDLCYNSNLVLGTLPERERFATTYGQLCAEAGSVAERMAAMKHDDVFTLKQSADPYFGKTRFPITSTPGITESKGPRDSNAIRKFP
ncbi:hypothetical protein KFE25_002139 [Diacronema lutheri]|uniref:Uncharacterized protein n=1 Tax=Diacronema lutheri TaxID=2081491 RepID=A0A8J5XFZ9_DIALT|nr:hypothetical protein KFE25_002139 [Diacronema lutheri]